MYFISSSLCNLEPDGDDLNLTEEDSITNRMPYKTASAALTMPGGVVPAVPHFSVQRVPITPQSTPTVPGPSMTNDQVFYCCVVNIFILLFKDSFDN